MGLQQSKPLDRKPSRSKSSLSEKAVPAEEIAQFSSQLNHLVSLDMDSDPQKYDYLIFKKIPFTGKFVPLPLCSKISTSNDSVFICYDCSSDPHAYLCQQCFQKGKHQGHRFSVFPNNAKWEQLYCRCGDYDYMNKGTICEQHKKIKQKASAFIDPKEKKVFISYFNEIFKTLFSLLQKSRGADSLLRAFFAYLQKATTNNLLFSKTLCEFLLEKSLSKDKKSNLYELLTKASIPNTNFFRNLTFATEYKMDILRQIILALNDDPSNVKTMTEVILNMDGKIECLQKLAKQEKLILGSKSEENQYRRYFPFYDKLISNDFSPSQIWKCLIQNKLIIDYIKHNNIIRKIIEFLFGQKDKELKMQFLEQLLECDVQSSQKYIIPTIMILTPQCIFPSKSQKEKQVQKRLSQLFTSHFQRIFNYLSTNNSYEQSFEKQLLLLPFFSFGPQVITRIWEQFQRRVNILQKNKQKAVIKNGSQNYFTFLTKLLKTFFGWEHQIIQIASQNKLKSFSNDNQKLIERLLKQSFQRRRKFPRSQMLQIIDMYTQNNRTLAVDVIKKFLRYNTKKGKYYYIGDQLLNNLCNYEQLQVGTTTNLSEWQELVAGKFFTQKLYSIVIKLIKIAQRGLMEDIQMVKTVSNMSIGLALLRKSQKKQLKTVTRNFIKEIPDVSEDVYYVLAGIRDRFELDLDDLQEQGMKGRKKQKLDLITEIRDKKYRQMKQQQDKILKEWLSKIDQKDNQEQEIKAQEENFCHICKEKANPKNRLVYLCNFTRNNVVSTLLKSQVTDLDMNICLHRVHQQCYDKVMNKRHCPVCKFEVNCYIPEKPLSDESYTKNWLRNFENIVTRINLESGKSFSSDWATIFLTYLVFSRSFRVLLNNTQLQAKQISKIDSLLMLHYKSQLQKWPQLTKQALKRAQKTVKGQVRRESNIKKNVKSLVFDLVMQQITNEPFKNQKRVEKKIRELVNFVGQEKAQKIAQGFQYCRTNEAIKQILSQSISEEHQQVQQMFQLKPFPSTAQQYLQKTSILCPMCGKYQSTTWKCLFCDKTSCSNCTSDYNHCDRDHRGSSIIVFLNNAEYKLVHQNREVQRDSLYRNQYEEGWRRNYKPEGWKLCTKEINEFFDAILHSKSIRKNNAFEDNSDDGRQQPGFGFGFGFQNQGRFNQNIFGIRRQQEEQDNEDQEEQQENEEEEE